MCEHITQSHKFREICKNELRLLSGYINFVHYNKTKVSEFTERVLVYRLFVPLSHFFGQKRSSVRSLQRTSIYHETNKCTDFWLNKISTLSRGYNIVEGTYGVLAYLHKVQLHDLHRRHKPSSINHHKSVFWLNILNLRLKVLKSGSPHKHGQGRR